MKNIILIITALTITACNEAGGESAASAESPVVDSSPFDPSKTYAEIDATWFYILPTVITVRYNSVSNKVYVCDEAFCRNNDSRSDDITPGQCTYSSGAYGSYEICFTEITDELTMINSVWVSIEELP